MQLVTDQMVHRAQRTSQSYLLYADSRSYTAEDVRNSTPEMSTDAHQLAYPTLPFFGEDVRGPLQTLPAEAPAMEANMLRYKATRSVCFVDKARKG